MNYHTIAKIALQGEKVFFVNLKQRALKDLDQQKVVNTYKKGQTLFVEGNPPMDFIALVLEILKSLR